MSATAPLLVLKFGGTSLADTARVQRAAQRIRNQRAGGARVLAVVSAAGDATDVLLDQINALCPDARVGAREADRVLATGEDRSAALLALALAAAGVQARSLRGGEAGIRGRGAHGAGVIAGVDTAVLRDLLARGSVPVVSGFQATGSEGETLTLGRGGSDISAVALGAALGARAVHIITDVDAIYDSDPNLNPEARPYAALDHAGLVRLTGAGAGVVHPRAAQLAAEHALALHVYHHEAALAALGTVVDSTPAAAAAGRCAVA